MKKPLLAVLDDNDPAFDSDRFSYPGLSADQVEKYRKQGFSFFRGKVRDCLAKDGRLQIIHTDRLSAFDCAVGLAPMRGIVLAAMNIHWINAANTHGIPVAPCKQLDQRTLETVHGEPIRAEIIVRGYIAGSMLRAYQAGQRLFCGQVLREGLRPFQKLDHPIITPTTKAEAYGHDAPTEPTRLIAEGILSKEEWRDVQGLAIQLFELGTQRYRDCGWILADTKYELARMPDGSLQVIDEIHTPDSSRLWPMSDYEQRSADAAPTTFDKDIVRRYLEEQGFTGDGTMPCVPRSLLLQLTRRYAEVCENITGELVTIQT